MRTLSQGGCLSGLPEAASAMLPASGSLYVDGLAERMGDCLLHCLRQGRMRMRGRENLCHRQLRSHSETGLDDQVSHVRTNEVNTQDLAMPGVHHRLDEALVVAQSA